jgi:mRNA-decapping enzyme subunit 2
MASSSSSSPEILGATSEGHFSYKHATHDEVLEDLSRLGSLSHPISVFQLMTNSRFILNLPDDELSSLERICFQVEQAYVSPALHLQR